MKTRAELPDGYIQCAENAKRAAYAYAREHPFAEYMVHHRYCASCGFWGDAGP